MNQRLSQSPVTAHPTPALPASPNPPARILIVDDDHLLCGLHSLVLERHGYDTVTAENGEDALTQLSFGHFDLMITDRSMPVLDGASLVLALRSAGSRIPVIMISGSLALSPLPPAVAREVNIALLKPAHPKEIVEAVAQVLKTHPTCGSRSPAFNSSAPIVRF
ncbi:response regulator receiver protein [Chthoniobacter flavus Ellin428]|uniref:Response regulator receiver protein n=1 Tax=Chthoniobacter flavus Ellin428 TaxID=497964 RepID=B4DAD8_9BACT|nr:response regulator [Chthoniobacter flavus]EDY16599.1 response regulator receiver protein [Chthoniobacter flavus Ellin428]TCO91980.1 response regulator receiver domain-containing protein [Chthoniobacter flavus]